MAKKLIFDLEKFATCKAELTAAVEELQTIQDNLQKAIDKLVEPSGWNSDGSAAFVQKYDDSWVAGINDRKAIINRMIDHLTVAETAYKDIAEDAASLKLNTD